MEPEDRKVGWIELLFDLVFVVAIANAKHYFLQIEDHPTQIYSVVVRYALMVIPMWWCWTGQTMLMNRFEKDMRNPKVFIILQMVFVILMSASFDLNFDNTYYTFLIGYVGVRAITMTEYIMLSQKCLASKRRAVASYLAKNMSIGVIIALASVLFSSPTRYIVLYVAMIVDIIMPLFNRHILSGVPAHLGHLSERVGLLVMITFGEAIVSIVNLLDGHTFDLNRILFCLLNFVFLVTLWLGYFNNEEDLMDKEIKKTGQVLLYGNLLLVVSIMIIAGLFNLATIKDTNIINTATEMLGICLITFILTKRFIFQRYSYDNDKFLNRNSMLLIVIFLLIFITGEVLKLTFTPLLILYTILAIIDNLMTYTKKTI